MILFIVYETEPDRMRRSGDDADEAMAAAKACYGCASWAQLVVGESEP